MSAASTIGRISRGLLLVAASLVANASADAATSPPCAIPKDINTPAWTARCTKALEREHDLKKRATLLFGRAYAAVDQYRYDAALIDLDAAVSADPDCARCRHERAFLNSELGEYAKAIEDLDREIELAPTAGSYQERAYARQFNGDLVGAWRDRVRVTDLDPDSPGSLLARAEAAAWMGQFETARADAGRALTQAKEQGDEKQQTAAAAQLRDLELLTTTSPGENPASRCVMQSMAHGDSTVLIGDCTRAFFEAPDNKAKAEVLATRATAWRVLANDEDQAAGDMRVAAGLDPNAVAPRINLGYAYLQSSHSWAANREFERALAIERNWLALAGRAQARMNLGDAKGARIDAEESLAAQPNEAAAWVLADLALAHLKELGVDDPAKVIETAADKQP
jgi:tetratricopeptide (TPR) repeat protein